jgi:ribosomal protein S18 acetylase RimI-like enzyme
MPINIRHAEPEDYDSVIRVVDAWWGGRRMADMLPRLFFTHFRPTSFVAEIDGTVAGFVTGFISATCPEQAYIHFVGVDPATRGSGVGRALYERFFAAARGAGCDEVLAVTSPRNAGSIAFHHGMGFEALPGSAKSGEVPFTPDYDGPGEDRVRFRRGL